MVCFYFISRYLYAVIGMEAFSRYSRKSDTPVAEYFLYGCGLGFKNFKCAGYIVFQVATTNNWHEVMYTVSHHNCTQSLSIPAVGIKLLTVFFFIITWAHTVLPDGPIL